MGPVSPPAPPPASSPRGFGRGTSSVSARRHRVVWAGTARSSPSRPMTAPISPSVRRSASRHTALNVRAVRIARSEYSACPPRLVRRSASHASSENQTVKLPRRRRLSSYSRRDTVGEFAGCALASLLDDQLREAAMSLRPAEIAPVPARTAQVAVAAFPRGCAAMRMRDELGAIYDDQMFASLFPARGQPAYSPWRLALVTVLQFAEGLPDRQAADAGRGRVDWKYVLRLELADPGFDFAVLCEFRARLIAGGLEQSLREALLTRSRERGLLKARGRQRTDSTHGLAAGRKLNRSVSIREHLECLELVVIPLAAVRSGGSR